MTTLSSASTSMIRLLPVSAIMVRPSGRRLEGVDLDRPLVRGLGAGRRASRRTFFSGSISTRVTLSGRHQDVAVGQRTWMSCAVCGGRGTSHSTLPSRRGSRPCPGPRIRRADRPTWAPVLGQHAVGRAGRGSGCARPQTGQIAGAYPVDQATSTQEERGGERDHPSGRSSMAPSAPDSIRSAAVLGALARAESGSAAGQNPAKRHLRWTDHARPARPRRQAQ